MLQGFQQQDSHELLRVLLDGLQTEEAKAIAARLKYMPPEVCNHAVLVFLCNAEAGSSSCILCWKCIAVQFDLRSAFGERMISVHQDCDNLMQALNAC